MKSNVLMLNITNRCNAQCRMCGIWQDPDNSALTVDDVVSILDTNADVLSRVTTVGLVGGEPFLHESYCDIVTAVIERLPNLKSIGTPTNGLAVESILSTIAQVLSILPDTIYYGVSVSVDGVGLVHDEIRNIPGAFSRCDQLIDTLQKEFGQHDNFYTTLTTTLCRKNMHAVDDILRYANEKRIRYTIRPAMVVDSPYIKNEAFETSPLHFDETDYPELIRIFQRLYEYSDAEYYHMIARMYAGEARSYPCPFQNEGLVINPDTSVYMCLFSGKGYLGNLKKRDMSLQSLVDDATYKPVQERVLTDACPMCLSECFTSRSSDLPTQVSSFEAALSSIVARKMDDANGLISNCKNHALYDFLSGLYTYVSTGELGEYSPCSHECTILQQMIVSGDAICSDDFSRNSVAIDYSLGTTPDESLKLILIQMAKYYYILKMYKNASMYVRLVSRFCSVSRREEEMLGDLKKRMNMGGRCVEA